MRFSWATLLLSGLALGHPTSNSRAVFESAKQLPQGWRLIGPAEDRLPLRLSIALKQPGLSDLKARLEVTSDPAAAEYGAHVSRDAMEAYQEPGEEAYHVVASWLEDYGIYDFKRDGAWVRFNTTVGGANRLLDCRFAQYRYGGEEPALRAREYALPARLAEHIDFVFPVTQFLSRPPRIQDSVRDVAKVKRADTSKSLALFHGLGKTLPLTKPQCLKAAGRTPPQTAS